MRPTLRQMEYVVKVHELGGFRLAAEALNVSQPSLSNQIAAIENDLGVRLFKRGPGRVNATANGSEFIKHARRILADAKALRSSMTSSLPYGGRLRLGTLQSIGPYLLPKVLRCMHLQQPELRVVVREESTLALEEGIKNGRFDAIISTPADHPNTRQCPLFIEPLWVAVSVTHPIAEKSCAEAPDLAGQNLLTLDAGHRLSRIVYSLAARSGGTVSDNYEGTSLDSVVLMAASGAGIGIVPDLFARHQANRDDIVLRPLEMEGANREISVLFPADDPFEECGDQLTVALRDTAKHLDLAMMNY